ncbi:MAG: RNA polymerase sigma factor [Desulfuromonadales bacterium]
MTDEELMLAYATDDMDAFEVLYRRHKNRIFGFLLTRLKNRTEAEEVFQAVFTKLHVARGRYRSEIPFLPWVFTIARNAMIDHIRRRDSYQKHILSSETPLEDYAAPVAEASPTDISSVDLSRLNVTQRQALEFRFAQGLTFAEIGERLTTSEENARQIISRALRKLRKMLTGKEEWRDKN